MTESILPLLILCNNDNDGNGKFPFSIRYDLMHVYGNSNAYISWFRLIKQVSLWTCFCNSSNIGKMFSMYDSRYTGKCPNMLFLKWRQSWPGWNHCWREKEHPLEKKLDVQFTINLDTTLNFRLACSCLLTWKNDLIIVLLKWISWWTKILIDVT